MKRPDWWTDDYCGDRIRWQAGDLIAHDEDQTGSKAGKRFVIDVQLADHIGEFDQETYDRPHVDFMGRPNNRGWNEAQSHYYLSYSFCAVFWRWGVAVQVRGREIGRYEWALPEEQEA